MFPTRTIIGLENTKVTRDEKGFIKVDSNQRTTDESIYAIGDIAGGILLAHKAFREGRIAVEAITGESHAARNSSFPQSSSPTPKLPGAA